MPTYTFTAYDAGALDFSGGAVALRPGYSPADRVEIEIRDNDESFDGDHERHERGDDADQKGRVRDMKGHDIASGRIYVEEYFVLEGPDGTIWVDILEIDGVVVGYFPSEPLEPGVIYENLGALNVDDGNHKKNRAETEDGFAAPGQDTRNSHEYYRRNSVPCFRADMRIATRRGPLEAGAVREGDHLLTLDRGWQPVLWVGRARLVVRDLASDGLRPVRLPGCGGRDLVLSGNHRLLVRHPTLAPLFGVEEALAPALSFLSAGRATRCEDREVSYVHLLCRRHEVILAEGVWVESLLTGAEGIRSMPPMMRRGLGLRPLDMRAARLCLKPREAALLGASLGPCTADPAAADPALWPAA